MTVQEASTQRLTIKDVARHIGVSTATISNAFHRPDQLSVQLRERVLNACDNLGYAPPLTTERRRRTFRRNGIIGILLSDCLSYNLSDRAANQFLTGLTEVFGQAQLGMLMLSARDIDNHYRLRQHAGLVEGFIAYGKIDNEQLYEQLHKLDIPLVTVDCLLNGHSSISCDDFGGAKACAQHALQHQPRHAAVLGHRLIDSRHVCRVYEPSELFGASTSVSVQRLLGYQEAFAEYNRPLGQDRVWHIPANAQDCAQQAAREALLSTPRPNLILCMSDLIAMAALQEAKTLGIRVPEELHIVGFGGFPEFRDGQPSLTTVCQDHFEKGRQAAQCFLEPKTITDLVLPTKLAVGDSCPLPNQEGVIPLRSGT